MISQRFRLFILFTMLRKYSHTSKAETRYGIDIVSMSKTIQSVAPSIYSNTYRLSLTMKCQTIYAH